MNEVEAKKEIRSTNIILAILFVVAVIIITVISLNSAKMSEVRRKVLIVQEIASNGILASNPQDESENPVVIVIDTSNLNRGDFVNGLGELIIEGSVASRAYEKVAGVTTTILPTPSPTSTTK